MAFNYFEDQIQQGKPIVPPTAAQSPTPPVQPVQPTVSGTDEWKGLPVRAVGDRVFLIKGGKKYWVTNPEVYTKLGFKLGDEVKIDQATLDVLPDGDPIR